MNTFLSSIDQLFSEYNSLLKKKIKTTVDFDKLYQDFKEDQVSSSSMTNTTSSKSMVLQNKDKKKKTAYQNFFTITRTQLTNDNKKIPFGELSKIISTKWKELSIQDKKSYSAFTEPEHDNMISSNQENKNSQNNLENFFIEEENTVRSDNSNLSEMSVLSEINSEIEDDEDSLSFNFEED